MIKLNKNSQSIFKNIISWGGSSLVETLSKLIVTATSVWFLNKDDFALINLGLLYFSYLTLFQFGLSDSLRLKLSQFYVNSDEKKYCEYSSVVVTITTISVLIHSLLAILIFFFIGDSNQLTIIIIFSLTGLLYNIHYHYILFYRFQGLMRYTLRSRIIMASIRIFPQIAMLYMWGIVGFLVAEIIVYFASVLYFNLILRENILKFNIRWNILTDLMRDAKYFFIMILFGLLGSSFDRWIVFSTDTSYSFASYSLLAYVSTIALFPASQILSVFSQHCREFIENSSNNNRMGEIRDVFLAGLFLTNASYFIITIFIYKIYKFIIVNFLNQYSDSLALLGVFMMLIVARVNSSYYNTLSNSMGMISSQANFNVLHCLIYIILILILSAVSVLKSDYVANALFLVTTLINLISAYYYLRIKLGIGLHKITFFNLPYIFISTLFILFENIPFNDLSLPLIAALILLLISLSLRSFLCSSEFMTFINFIMKSHLQRN